MADVTAQLSGYRQSPRKVRLLADLIRGKSVDNAIIELDIAVKRASAPFKQLLLSAIANAKNNYKLEQSTLYIKRVAVDGGSPLKRSMPRMGGRAFPIHKHTSHISIVLAERAVKSTKSKSTKTKLSTKDKPE
ncbi:MAG: 50S ribosomal protein L22 [Candidatus Vogelbacteria bacterium]|nr:50S ribosomal protein L22 [Candidatus Vogelbacteria bacterium]